MSNGKFKPIRLTARQVEGFVDVAHDLALNAAAASPCAAPSDALRLMADFLGQFVLAATRFAPAVPPGESVHPDHLVCLVDGAKVKMLRAYIKRFDLTAESYRRMFDLPPDYPMVAPGLTEKKRSGALTSQLGRRPEGGRHPVPRRDAGVEANFQHA